MEWWWIGMMESSTLYQNNFPIMVEGIASLTY